MFLHLLLDRSTRLRTHYVWKEIRINQEGTSPWPVAFAKLSFWSLEGTLLLQCQQSEQSSPSDWVYLSYCQPECSVSSALPSLVLFPIKASDMDRSDVFWTTIRASWIIKGHSRQVFKYFFQQNHTLETTPEPLNRHSVKILADIHCTSLQGLNPTASTFLTQLNFTR